MTAAPVPDARPFGRRDLPAPPRAPAPAPAFVSPPALDPRAEAFRAELAASRAAPGSGFADWRRSQAGSQVMIWVLGAAFLSPGLVCFVLQAPLEVSIGLEVAGVIINTWLRRERRRRRREILEWRDQADG